MTVPHPLPTLYGLKQCDSCRKARRLLDELGVTYRFIDLRADATDAEGLLDSALLAHFMATVPWETLLNRRSTTWRQLDAADREALDADKARALLRQHPTLLKRPLLVTDSDVIVGIDDARYSALA
ncbi:Spx/MgsR family RNA polymerase-binding regulatory protein [Zymobacter sp. IVIA_12111.31 C1]|uniref:Spx/MgsR family RNA polymerase-binding regulatory protein n=1 Tax=Zymobacter sp. IVIA_12111.31 C1 TaxID=3394854 RepID=UPI0039C3F43B